MNTITCNIHRFGGNIQWLYNNGSQLVSHNNNGPAVIWQDGEKNWLVNDKRHRTDGPAFEYPNGNKLWFINGIRYHDELEYWIAIQATTVS